MYMHYNHCHRRQPMCS